MNKLNISAAIQSGWRLAKEHFIISIGLLMAYIAIFFFLSLFSSDTGGGVIIYLLSMAVTLIWQMGIYRISVDAVDGETPRFGVFQEMLPRLWSFILLNLIILFFYLLSYFVIILVGAISCGISLTTLASANVEVWTTLYLWIILSIIPFIYLNIRLYFVAYLFVDRGVGAVDAIKMSWKATEPIQGKLFLFILLIVLINLLGFICFFVGSIFTIMLSFYAMAALYRQVFPAGIQDPLLVEDANVVIE